MLCLCCSNAEQNSVHCLLFAPSGNQLQLNFIEFDVEESSGCNQDYIEVHEMNPAGPLLLHNCSSSTGSTLPPSVTVHDTLWIKFRSDGVSAGGRGFLASYSICESQLCEKKYIYSVEIFVYVNGISLNCRNYETGIEKYIMNCAVDE